MHKARGFAWETDNNGHLQIPIPTSGNPSGPGYRVTHTCIKPSQKSSNVLSQSYVCEERTLYYLIPFEWMSLSFFFFLSTAALFCLHNRLSYFNSTPESIYVYCNHRWCWALFLVCLVLKTKPFVISNINWSEGIRSSLGSLSNKTGIIGIPLHCWNPAVLFLSFCFSLFFLSLQRPSAWQSGKTPESRVRREVEEGRELHKEEGAPSSGCLETEICLEQALL